MSGNSSLLLDQQTWDLVADLDGNIAVADAPYAQAQDAASAMRTFQGEVFYDVNFGIPYWARVLGQITPMSLIKAYWNQIALTVPGLVSAQAFISSFVDRKLVGQVQVTNSAGETSAAVF